MTIQEFKKIARVLKQVYREFEMEALKKDLDLTSPEYDVMVAEARLAVLKKFGFSLEEYRQAKLEAETERKKEKPQYDEIKKQVDSIKVPSKEEIEAIAEEVAKKFITAPQVINKIVKEIKIERPPQVIKETVHTTERVEYDDAPLRAELGYVADMVEKIEIPKPLDVDKLKQEITSESENRFAENFEKNIDTYGMPAMRKLGMGLQGQIDTKIEGVNTHKLTVSATEPANPKLNDLWVDIS